MRSHFEPFKLKIFIDKVEVNRILKFIRKIFYKLMDIKKNSTDLLKKWSADVVGNNRAAPIRNGNILVTN